MSSNTYCWRSLHAPGSVKSMDIIVRQNKKTTNLADSVVFLIGFRSSDLANQMVGIV